MNVASVAVDTFANPLYQQGSLSSTNSEIRNQAIADTKEAMDFAAGLGCKIVTLWPGQDGYDYIFQADYIKERSLFQEALSELCEYRKDITLTLEYLEFIYWLRKTGYSGYMTLDQFPYREDGRDAVAESALWLDSFEKVMDDFDFEKIDSIIAKKDAICASKMMRKILLEKKDENRKLKFYRRNQRNSREYVSFGLE